MESNIKVAMITGAASGMGRVYALRMAAQGIIVAAVDQDKVALEALSREPGIFSYCADVRDAKVLLTIVEEHEARFGVIQRLVTCAAIMPTSSLAAQSTAEINQIMAVNYQGTVNSVASVLPAMLDRNEGQVIIFGSSGGYLPVPECGAYVASKFATNSYAETLIEENRGSDVQFLLVCPPLVDTPLLEQARQSANPKMIRQAIRQKRFVSADYIIDQIEIGLNKELKILIPGLATQLMLWLRRFSPRLVWWIFRSHQA